MAAEEPVELIRPVAVEYDDLLITSEKYAGKTHAEARRLIKKILDQMTFCVSTEAVSKDTASALLNDDTLPDTVHGKAVIHGVTWIVGNVDGTDDTGVIKYGKPVAVDTTTGKCVTGVNSKWSADEYKVIGTALDEVLSGKKRIPVLLGTPSAPEETVMMVWLKENIPASYGGFSYGYGDPNAKDLQYKNYIDETNTDADHPITKQVQLVYDGEAWPMKLEGDRIKFDFDNLPEAIKIKNTSRTPLTVVDGPLWVRKLNGEWVFDRHAANENGASYGAYSVHGELALRNKDAKIIRTMSPIDIDGAVYTPWVRAVGDILIMPGSYQITWGMDFYVGGGRVFDDSEIQTEPAAGHTHHIKNAYPRSVPVRMYLLRDFPGQDVPMKWDDDFSSFGGNNSLYQQGVTEGFLSPQNGNAVTLQRTSHFNFLLCGHANGQPYTRLSLCATVPDMGVLNSFVGIVAQVRKAWIQIRPANAFFYASTGYNPYLGEKTTDNPKGFQWWGGGPPPLHLFDENGVKIPPEDDNPIT
jgi:hypothetical protein